MRIDNAETRQKPAPVFDGSPLGLAFALAFKLRWRAVRNADRNAAMLKTWFAFFQRHSVPSLDEIGTAHLADFIEERQQAGDSPATIRQRFSVLKVVTEEAINSRPPLATKPLPRIRKPRVPREEKWWLTPERRVEMVATLRHALDDFLLADYVEFICETGLRVEEALRLCRRHFLALDTRRPNLIVPGTKTNASQKPMPISERAAAIARYRLAFAPADARLFPVTYACLCYRWSSYRPALGLKGIAGATLKALRRSFAGKLNGNGVPTETVMRLMRHSRITTTAGYLELVGASDLEGARKWLVDPAALSGDTDTQRDVGRADHPRPPSARCSAPQPTGHAPLLDGDYCDILETMMSE